MSRQDPELLENNEEGTGDENAYRGMEFPDYDPSQFELPDDFEYTEVEGDDEDASDE